jgi:hypothetical protein
MTEKKYKTVLCGNEAKLLDGNMGGDLPLLWKVNNGNNWITMQTDRDFTYYGVPYIVEVREPRTRWINEYPTGLSQVNYDSKEEADLSATSNRIACHAFQMVVK